MRGPDGCRRPSASEPVGAPPGSVRAELALAGRAGSAVGCAARTPLR